MKIEALLKELRISTKSAGHHEHARPGWVQIDCPKCSPRSGRYRMGINLVKGYANCWNCGGSRLVDVIRDLTGKNLPECYDLLRGIGWEKSKVVEKKLGTLKVPDGTGPLTKPHIQYLKGRGFDPEELVRLWGIQGVGISTQIPWNIFIPVYYQGEMVSWISRSIGDGEQRYTKAKVEEESFPLKDLLYGYDYVRHSVVIFEGPFDAWAVGPGAVAILGLNCSRAQINLMSEIPVRTVCFDSESAAQRRANRLAHELEQYPGETRVVELETGKDAAEADEKEIQELRKYLI